MSEREPFSLVVLAGNSRGQVLRTSRKRIAVGSAPDNDLVLSDAGLAPRHFLVLIDAGRWRIHTLSSDNALTVDRRWSHPSRGLRGALITAGSAELLLYPGDLEPGVIDRELKKREGRVSPYPDEAQSDLVTSVHAQPVEFSSREVANEPTVAVRMEDVARGREPPTQSEDIDVVKLSQMETVAGERPPDDLRDAARARLQGQRRPVAPSVLREQDGSNRADPLANQPVRQPAQRSSQDPWEERTIGVTWEDGKPVARPLSQPQESNGSQWDRAKRAPTAARVQVPEVLAEPESQILNAHHSVVAARPDFAAPTPSVRDPAAEVIELDPARAAERRRTNAWGDPLAKGQPKPSASDPGDRAGERAGGAWGEGAGRTNAWGDPSSRALVPKTPEPERPPRHSAWGDGPRQETKKPAGNAWGDGERVGSARSAQSTPASTAVPRGRALATRPDLGAGAAVRIALEALIARASDPALEILREPDGKLATSIRLLGTKIEDLARSLGYRAYMISSAEPLTGKTTAALNLALALSEDTQRRVALVEANFRYPRFAEILGVDERLGVLAALEGRAQLAESVVKVSDRNLIILPAGGRHPHPGEVLASPRFKTLIAELAHTVDVAILDAPPVKPFADANLLLPLVDGALLVVADRLTRTGWLGEATQQLGVSRVLGALYNHLPKDRVPELVKERKLRMSKKV